MKQIRHSTVKYRSRRLAQPRTPTDELQKTPVRGDETVESAKTMTLSSEISNTETKVHIQQDPSEVEGSFLLEAIELSV